MSTCDRCNEGADYVLQRISAECFGVDYRLLDAQIGQRDYCKKCFSDLIATVATFFKTKIDRKVK